MTIESPTLKVRLELLDEGAFIGRSCDKVAEELIRGGAVVLDAKWGRPPTKWRETGGGWGRTNLQLADFEKGYLAGCKAGVGVGDSTLIQIIERLTA